MISRRGFIGSLAALVVTAPAIVRPGLIMPIKPSLVPAVDWPLWPGSIGIQHWRLIAEEPVKCDFLEWALSFGQQRAIARTDIGKAHVSTIFLGIDHGLARFLPPEKSYAPVLFETMIFGGPHDGEMRRYCTYNEALKGHQEMATSVNGVDNEHDGNS